MAYNFSNSTPAAPSGSTNISWQTDGSGNVSANIGLASTKTTVAPSAGAVTINCALGNSFFVNVNAAITSMTLTNPTDGQEITLVFAQDGTGHAVALAANMLGSPTITTTANTHSVYRWTYNLANTTWYLINASGM